MVVDVQCLADSDTYHTPWCYQQAATSPTSKSLQHPVTAPRKEVNDTRRLDTQLPPSYIVAATRKKCFPGLVDRCFPFSPASMAMQNLLSYFRSQTKRLAVEIIRACSGPSLCLGRSARFLATLFRLPHQSVSSLWYKWKSINKRKEIVKEKKDARRAVEGREPVWPSKLPPPHASWYLYVTRRQEPTRRR